MLKSIRSWAVLALILLVPLNPACAAAAPDVAFSILKTGEAHPPEALVVSGGRLFHKAKITHSAILVRHGEDSLLFDTGLGRRIRDQVSADMPWWARPFFGFTPGASVAAQLASQGLPVPGLIVLSHAHWDHASGLEDFPGTPILATPEEVVYAGGRHPGSVFPSQFRNLAGRWRTPVFTGPEIEGYGPSHDVFGDGAVLLVRMAGHTPGALGMLLSASDGRRYFFVGDTVWSSLAIERQAPRFFLASLIVDADRRQAADQLARLGRFHSAHPEVLIVPSHDGQVQDQLGYFPAWVGR